MLKNSIVAPCIQEGDARVICRNSPNPFHQEQLPSVLKRPEREPAKSKRQLSVLAQIFATWWKKRLSLFQKARARGNPVNGFTKVTSEAHNLGEYPPIHLKIIFVHCTQKYPMSTNTSPKLPKLWTALDVSRNHELMELYHCASTEEKEAWRAFANDSRAPANNKKESTEANHDIAAVNRAHEQ